jgi:hypothetical protein
MTTVCTKSHESSGRGKLTLAGKVESSFSQQLGPDEERLLKDRNDGNSDN